LPRPFITMLFKLVPLSALECHPAGTVGKTKPEVTGFGTFG
jgi:hypothetical protein